MDMPGGSFHMVAAIALFLALLQNSSLGVAFAIFLLSSLVPDLDSKNSKIRKYASVAAAVVPALFVAVTLDADTAVRIASSVITFGSFYVMLSNAPTSHRGRKSLHNLGAGAAVSAVLGYLSWFFAGQEFITAAVLSFSGYSAHLAIDWIFNK
ncbi:MAG: metal-dependent hydrolase [Candidatus Aenigmatarchaeota archaeon]